MSTVRLNSTTQEHFDHPRNVGTLENATHRAKATNPVCADVMELDLRIENGRITAARFRAEGCAPTYAAGSLLTEKITGQEVAWAAGVTKDSVIGWLDGVPPGKEHVAHLAVEVLRLALQSPVGE